MHPHYIPNWYDRSMNPVGCGNECFICIVVCLLPLILNAT